MRRQCRNRNAADFLQREIQEYEFDHVRHLHDHAIERRQTQVEQVERQALARPIDLCIRVGLAPVEKRDAIAILPEDVGKLLGERLIPPIALVAIALRKFRRKRNHAFKHALPQVGKRALGASDRSRPR